MAKINFNDIPTTTTYETSNTNNDNIPFFRLKNDGDETVVRVMFDSVDDFDIVSYHSVRTNTDNYDHRVNCLREATSKNPNDCPLCSKMGPDGKPMYPVRTRIFIHLIQYENNPETGKIEGTPVIWERNATGQRNNEAQRLFTYLNTYGPLSDVLFKIVRHGAPRTPDGKPNLAVSYDWLPLVGSPIYRPEIYVKPEVNPFENYSPIGYPIMQRTAEEIMQYFQTGSLQRVRVETLDVTTPNDATYEQFTSPTYTPTPQVNTGTLPWEQPLSSDRPRRY